ncbi:MAG: hypothetical protein L0Z62_12855 [Gemmataceae bacterium]|nr:hypothetical protein [Gemmataceae bacterium]
MLSDHQRQLLTAYLDGQLGTRERKEVLRLLRKSPEAQELYRRLQKDSHDLIQLPRQTLPPEFAQTVVRTIAARGLRPGSPPPVLVPRGIPTWAGVAIAATVLLGVGTASYFSTKELRPAEMMALAPLDPLERPPIKDPPRNSFLGQLAATAAQRYAAEIGVRVPLAALGKKEERTRLSEQLRKEPAYHLDLDSGNSVEAVRMLTAAFKADGFELLIDAAANARLKKRQPKTSYIVYAEGLRTDQLVAILERLGRAEKVAPGSRRAFQGALLHPMNEEDRQHLSGLLGVPAAQLQPNKEVKLRPEGIVDPKAEKGPKGQPKPPRPIEGFAVVLAFDGPRGNADASREIQRFLHGRRQTRPGLQVYVVLHDASA